MKEFSDEEKREVYRRAASNMGIEEQARRELEETAKSRAELQAQAVRIERLLRGIDSKDNWTAEPLGGKSRVLVTAERGRVDEEDWLRTSVVFSIDTLEALDDDELVREVRTRVKVYRMGM